ncbi:hypothetical protein BDQ12DRAFT_719955 [Crucibulum laeve]|uniref:Roadblock/LAMTOR2 domain-containing protein n=1 Tax=Crucibulum laeve TaxID=68775 RepID=A0A5C3M9K7_9AGAR|nr:hypothetical protein BDQ12DRAFT_719955 [Crucibulum laeve]
MLMLSNLNNRLSQVLSLPGLHTAVLLTPAGELVSAASEPARPKDEIRVIVGLSGEVWHETRDQGFGMVDSELGRILVLPVDDTQDPEPRADNKEPLMLLALNSTDAVEWDDLQVEGRMLAYHLAKSLEKFRDHLARPKITPPPTNTTSPAPLRT